MHELAAIGDLVDAVVASVEAHQPCRVEVVRVRRGSTFSEDALRQGFEMLTRETPLEGAGLEIETVDQVVLCRCGDQHVMRAEDLVGHLWVCPNCAHVEEIDEDEDLAVLGVELIPAEAVAVGGGR